MPKHIIHAGGLAGTPSSIVIDVYDAEAPAILMDTIPNADIERVGVTQIYSCDLKEISVDIGLPEDGDPTERIYIFIFHDNLGITVSQMYSATGVSAGAVSDAGTREKPIYPSTTVPVRGITQNVIDGDKPSYIRVDNAPDGNFDAPATTFYWVFEYDAKGRVSQKTYSETPPSP